MAIKKYIGQLISIKYSDRKTPVFGIIIDYNDDWTLMHYNPDQFIIDGYVILKHKNIEGVQRGEKEIFREKVIKLKGLPKGNLKVPLNDLKTILEFIENKFGLFQFDTKSETACYIGKLISFDSKSLSINFLDTRAKWTGEMKFRPGDVRVIEFNSDYLNSLKLVAGIGKKKKQT